MYRTAADSGFISGDGGVVCRHLLTVLVHILEEAFELVDTRRCERLPFPPVQHASNDRSLDTFIQERHGRSRLDQLGQWWHELANQSRLLRRQDGELQDPS